MKLLKHLAFNGFKLTETASKRCLFTKTASIEMPIHTCFMSESKDDSMPYTSIPVEVLVISMSKGTAASKSIRNQPLK